MSDTDIVTELAALSDQAFHEMGAGAMRKIDRAVAEIERLRSLNAELVEALDNVAATCRGSGPWARDHDADTLRAIGKMIEPTLARATKESDHG